MLNPEFGRRRPGDCPASLKTRIDLITILLLSALLVQESNTNMNLDNLYNNDERGQGLVEYALILVLVAVVVIAVLLNLGPVVGDVFSKVNQALSMSGSSSTNVITGVTATRTGGGHGNDVVVSITVSMDSSVTISDSQSGQTQTATCNSSCSVTLTGVGAAAGTVTVTAAEGGTQTSGYSAKS
jgi:pilus assembly protein Flp/PilA